MHTLVKTFPTRGWLVVESNLIGLCHTV